LQDPLGRLIVADVEKSGKLAILSANFTQLYSIQAHRGDIAQFCVNPQCSLIATTSHKGTLVRVFDLCSSGDLLYELRLGIQQNAVKSISFNCTSTLLALAYGSTGVSIFSLIGPKERDPIPTITRTSSVKQIEKHYTSFPAYLFSTYAVKLDSIIDLDCTKLFPKHDIKSPSVVSRDNLSVYFRWGYEDEMLITYSAYIQLVTLSFQKALLTYTKKAEVHLGTTISRKSTSEFSDLAANSQQSRSDEESEKIETSREGLDQNQTEANKDSDRREEIKEERDVHEEEEEEEEDWELC